MTTGNKGSAKPNGPAPSNNGGMYAIKIKGLLDDHWGKWFEGMILERVENGEAEQGFTIIRGYLPDQPALHGLLAKIRDLNLTLISVYRINPATNSVDKNSPSRRSG